MTAPSKKKRLDDVEIALTPKEWALRLADQMRAHPSQADHLRAIAKGTFQDSPMYRPFGALKDQAERQHPGSKPEDSYARMKLEQSLCVEYQALKYLIFKINTYIGEEGYVTGLKAALKLARLEKIILQDAFGRTARKATEWVQEYKTVDADEEENRQGMLAELGAYADVDYGEKWADSVPLMPGVSFRFPSIIEDWIAEVVGLVSLVLSQKAAVQIILDKHFDGHSILYRDIEAGLNETIKTLEEGIEIFNAYLKTRAELFKAEWDADEEENDGIASAIPGERDGRLTIDIASIRATVKKIAGLSQGLVTQWIKEAKAEAKDDVLREPSGDSPGHAFHLFRERYGGTS